MKEPIIILSDLHLGLPASKIESVEQLCPMLEGAATVVFNGDTFQEIALELRARSEVLLSDLRKLCGEMGVETVFLSGNHDPGWEGPGWLELAGGRIVITHGDAVMWGGSPWSREAIHRRDQVRELWSHNQQADHDPEERIELAKLISKLLEPATSPKGRNLFRRVLDAVSPPKRALEILRVWLSQADKAAMFAERYFPRAEVLILGHFHRAGDWRRSGRLIVNTGAYVNPHRSMWVSYAGGWLRLGRVEEKDGLFVPAEAHSVWRMGSKEVVV